MKRLIAILLAVVVITGLMASPVSAAVVDTGVTVGTNSTPPYIICHTMTPDDTTGNGVQVNPEFAIPNPDGSFPPTDVSKDGWKMVKFYVEVGHINGIANINNVAVDVIYPETFNDVDAPLFASRAGQLKFEINAGRDINSPTGWSAQIVYPWSEVYPGNVPATMPDLAVRELVYNTPSDMVDVNCDDVLGNDSDKTWQNFLPYWTADRIQYNPDYNATDAFDLYQLGQALVLEIRGWMWFHQPGVKYTVEAKAATESGATSDVLGDGGKFLHYNRVFGLYCDFSNVRYLDVQVGGASWAEGDRYLNTSDKTTVWNNGNVGAEVLVSSTKMVKDYMGVPTNIHDSIYYGSPAKTIEHFDAKLYYTNGAGAVVQLGQIDYIADASPAVIANDGSGIGEMGAVLLQQCRPAKIEFSVHPELGEMQEAGNYAGYLTVAVQAYTGTQLPTL